MYVVLSTTTTYVFVLRYPTYMKLYRKLRFDWQEQNHSKPNEWKKKRALASKMVYFGGYSNSEDPVFPGIFAISSMFLPYQWILLAKTKGQTACMYR